MKIAKHTTKNERLDDRIYISIKRFFFRRFLSTHLVANISVVQKLIRFLPQLFSAVPSEYWKSALKNESF